MIDIDSEQPTFLDVYTVRLRPRYEGDPVVMEVKAQDQASALQLAELRLDGDPDQYYPPEIEIPGARP